ncbi:MAG: hypothetical protein ABIH48_02335 [Candidatus Falkowbacteria bacterium]
MDLKKIIIIFVVVLMVVGLAWFIVAQKDQLNEFFGGFLKNFLKKQKMKLPTKLSKRCLMVWLIIT